MAAIETRWAVLELTPKGDGEDPEEIVGAIRKLMKTAEVFIPASISKVGEDKVVRYLVDGYAFVRYDPKRPASDYYNLEDTKYIQTVLTDHSGSHRKIQTIPDSEIEKMRAQVVESSDQGIGIGDIVRITSGPYKNIRAAVIEDIPEEDKVQVEIKLRSKQDLVSFPRSFLVVEEKAPHSALLSKLVALNNWARMAGPVIQWSGTITPLRDTYRSYEKVVVWIHKGTKLYPYARLSANGFQPWLDHIKNELKKLAWYSKVSKKFDLLYYFVGAYMEGGHANGATWSFIQSKLIELVWLEDVLERTNMLQNDVDDIGRSMSLRAGGASTIQNVIIDGHNLAYRCSYAKGLAELTDKKGRPTGIVMGFFRSLESLRKRYREAKIWVTWDGSSKRRKGKYAEYKAGRKSHIDPRVVPIIQDILPHFGIIQALNSDEEADDIIATLVRRDLEKDNNLIFSTDRDLLQLVTSKTTVLVPAVGARNEVLYDVDTVEKVMGVPPEKVVQLRAFYGDTSDNIEGVPRVPKKVLKSLIQTHGSINGIYRSGLNGLTKGQYERIRLSEPQVRINLELMTLLDVDVTLIAADNDKNVAKNKLRDLEIQSASLAKTFFGEAPAEDPVEDVTL